jgi:hypothetical protein
MTAPLFFLEHERLAAAWTRGDGQVVAGRSCHKPLCPEEGCQSSRIAQKVLAKKNASAGR